MRSTAGAWELAVPAAIFLSCAAAQDTARIGIVRGELIAWEGAATAGFLDIRDGGGLVSRCTFDVRSSFERDNQRIAPAAIRATDRVEVVADRFPGSPACYARTVHVMDAAAWKGARRSPTEAFAPRGDVTFAGVVLKLSAEDMVLRTRLDGPKHILLRQDTRYSGDGLAAEKSALKVSTRVFIRAGHNLDGEIEAYQIVWGAIPSP